MKYVFCSVFVSAILFLMISCQSTENELIKPDKSNDTLPIPFEEIKASTDEDKSDMKLADNNPDDANIKSVTLTPPTNIKPLIIAEDSVEGYYIPTFDFGERGELAKYALIISEEDDDKLSWFLCEIDENAKHKNIGGGFFTMIEGGIDLEEFNLPGKTSKPTISVNEVISRERFPAEFSRNELHIVKAFESDGKSSLSKLIDKYGELYFIRVADSSDTPLPTSQIVGTFHPADLKTGKIIKNVTLYIWSNGIWLMTAPASYLSNILGEEPDEETSNIVKVRGTWKTDDDEITFLRETKCMLDKRSADVKANPPSETYKFVFDTNNFILWLTFTVKSETAPVGVSKNLKLNQTSVFLP